MVAANAIATSRASSLLGGLADPGSFGRTDWFIAPSTEHVAAAVATSAPQWRTRPMCGDRDCSAQLRYANDLATTNMNSAKRRGAGAQSMATSRFKQSDVERLLRAAKALVIPFHPAPARPAAASGCLLRPTAGGKRKGTVAVASASFLRQPGPRLSRPGGCPNCSSWARTT